MLITINDNNDQRTNERINKRTHERTNGTNGQTNKRTNKQTTYKQTNERTSEQAGDGRTTYAVTKLNFDYHRFFDKILQKGGDGVLLRKPNSKYEEGSLFHVKV